MHRRRRRSQEHDHGHARPRGVRLAAYRRSRRPRDHPLPRRDHPASDCDPRGRAGMRGLRPPSRFRLDPLRGGLGPAGRRGPAPCRPCRGGRGGEALERADPRRRARRPGLRRGRRALGRRTHRPRRRALGARRLARTARAAGRRQGGARAVAHGRGDARSGSAGSTTRQRLFPAARRRAARRRASARRALRRTTSLGRLFDAAAALRRRLPRPATMRDRRRWSSRRWSTTPRVVAGRLDHRRRPARPRAR